MPEITDITPDDSVVPIYSVVYSRDEPEFVELAVDEISPDEKMAQIQADRENAIAKLAKLGLTENEVRAVIGF